MSEWQDVRTAPPPRDHTEIELRFGSDPIPWRTLGVVYHRTCDIFGPSPVVIMWRPAPKKPQ